MAKPGRKRKPGLREPNGRLSRAERTNYWQRQRDALIAASIDPRMGTPLGILYRAEKVTTNQFDAGNWFADLRRDADAALSLPARNPRAQDMNAIRGLSNAEEDEQRKRRAVEAYDRACDYVGLGSKELAALQLVVVYERRPDTYEQALCLITGLNKLVEYRTGRRKAA